MTVKKTLTKKVIPRKATSPGTLKRQGGHGVKAGRGVRDFGRKPGDIALQ